MKITITQGKSISFVFKAQTDQEAKDLRNASLDAAKFDEMSPVAIVGALQELGYENALPQRQTKTTTKFFLHKPASSDANEAGKALTPVKRERTKS